MPILMVALIALAAFGLIGIVLGAAVVLEQRKIIGKHQPATPERPAQSIKLAARSPSCASYPRSVSARTNCLPLRAGPAVLFRPV